ncbi:MAG TPA: hypothetical protein VFT22_00600 [Kofleriaceae bacterium]|nr:hypothetical protein [Kofleriaceae bacterium]
MSHNEESPEIGTPHPVSLVEAAITGRWLVMCQARRDTDGKPGILVRREEEGSFVGDKMQPYLVRGGGAGVGIEGFVAASGDDRWIVVVRDGKLVLIDDLTGRERALPGGDARGEWHGDRIVAAFDDRGERLAYARWADGKSSVVIHELASQRERELRIDDGVVWQVTGVPGYQWLTVDRILTARPSLHVEDWPSVTDSKRAGVACRGVDASSFYRGISPRLATTSLLPSTGEMHEETAADLDAWRKAMEAAARVGSGGDTIKCEGETCRISSGRTGEVITLPGKGSVSPRAGNIVAIGTRIVDLTIPRVIGEVAQEPLAVDASGRALVPVHASDFEHPAIGPLRWMSPQPRAARRAYVPVDAAPID